MKSMTQQIFYPFLLVLLLFHCPGSQRSLDAVLIYNQNTDYTGVPMLRIDSMGHTSTVLRMTKVNNTNRILSAGYDKEIREWDTTTGQCLRTIRIPIEEGMKGIIYALAISPDNKYIAVGGYMAGWDEEQDVGLMNSILIIDYKTGFMIKRLSGMIGMITALDFSDNGEYLASGSVLGSVCIWQSEIWNNQNQMESLNHFHFNGNSTEDGQLELHHFFNNQSDIIYNLEFTSDASKIISASYDGSIIISNVPDGSVIQTLKTEGRIRCMDLSEDDKLIIAGDDNNSIYVFNANTGELLKKITDSPGEVSELTINPDSSMVFAGKKYQSHQPSPKGIIYDLSNYQVIAMNTDNEEAIVSSVWSQDENSIITGDWEGNIYKWDVNSGETLISMTGKGRAVSSIGWLSNNNLCFGLTSEVDNEERVNNKGEIEYCFSLDSWDYNNNFDRSAVRLAEINNGNRSLDGFLSNNLLVEQGGQSVLSIEHAQDPSDLLKSYSFSPDGALIAVGSNYSCAIYKSDTGERLFNLIGHNGEVRSLAFSPNGDYLATCGNDQTIRIFSTQSGNLLISFFFTRDRQWVAWTSSGYYSCSADGDSMIGWLLHKGYNHSPDFFYAKEMMESLYRPNIVDLTFKNNSEEQALNIAQTSAVNIQQVLPPKIIIITPANELNTDQENIELIADIIPSSNNQVIEEVKVFLNAGLIYSSSQETRGLTVVERSPQSSFQNNRLRLSIPLESGENEISIVATTPNTICAPTNVMVQYTGSTTSSTTQKTLHILSIGVSEFTETSYNLKYAASDAESISSAFSQYKDPSFERVNQLLLINDQANKNSIVSSLNSLKNITKPSDTLIVFIAGHGVLDQYGNYYYIPYDGNLEQLTETCLLWTTFTQVMNTIPSRTLFIVDTCHAGNVFQVNSSSGVMIVETQDATAVETSANLNVQNARGLQVTERVVRQLSNDETGIIVLMSSTGQELSLEDDALGHGIFTLSLIEGIQGKADLIKDDVVEIFELQAYLVNRVALLSEDRQHPTIRIPGQSLMSFPVSFIR